MRIPRFLLFLPLAFTLSAAAEIRLPNIFSDHAVLQRDRPVRIWGWSLPLEKITVCFHDQTVLTQSDAIGDWEIWLKPEQAGGPYTLSVRSDSSTKAIERSDILVGDVWLASGQSNMEFPLGGFKDAPLKDGDKEIAAATHPLIHLLLQRKATSAVPLDDISDTWTLCTPETARNFSAVAYFFGREISARENIPVGLIDATWGGTPAHSWISPEAMGAANLTSIFNDAGTVAHMQASANHIRDQYARQDAELATAGKPPVVHPRVPGDHEGAWTPGTLFNAMIAPDTRFILKGFLWYQGETDSDAQRVGSYARVFPTLISDWRRQWAEGDLPFLYVQISSYASAGGWPEVRDAQRRTLSLRNTGMAVTLDVGAAKNVHPPDKQTVGKRLALIARATVYGEPIEYSSPEYIQATRETGAMRVWLSHADGLTSSDKEIGGFEVAGEDHKYKPASARIEIIGIDQTILASSPDVPTPRYVRYGWSGVVPSYLYNQAGLPIGTFTSEE
jgi:sialate O-acetylesterase